MNSYRAIANQYHAAANKLAARGDRQGALTVNQQKGIAYYRTAAEKVEALMLLKPESISEENKSETV